MNVCRNSSLTFAGEATKHFREAGERRDLIEFSEIVVASDYKEPVQVKKV